MLIGSLLILKAVSVVERERVFFLVGLHWNYKYNIILDTALCYTMKIDGILQTTRRITFVWRSFEGDTRLLFLAHIHISCFARSVRSIAVLASLDSSYLQWWLVPTRLSHVTTIFPLVLTVP